MSGGVVLVLGAILAASMLILCYLLFIWWLDRYEREPFWLVILTFFWGAFGGTCFSCIVNTRIGLLAKEVVGPQAANVFTVVVVAPTIEEVMKGLIFLPLLLIGNNIDNRTDGLIYGAATGLGFSFLENLWYYTNNFNAQNPESLLALIFMRTMFTSLVHCISSALLGMAIGYARHRSGTLRWMIWPFLGYCFAVMNHATWNGVATLSGFLNKDPNLAAGALLLGCLIVAGASVMMFIITQMSLHSEHKFIRKHLLEEAKRGVIPAEHADIIPFWLRRMKSGWLPPGVKKGAYIKAATLLAFRHHQLEIADGERRQQYLEDIAKYRAEVAQLLQGGR